VRLQRGAVVQVESWQCMEVARMASGRRVASRRRGTKMTKPWEQQWMVRQVDRCSVPEVHGPSGLIAKVVVRYVSENKRSIPQTAAAREESDLLALSPAMARALRRLLLAFPTAHATEEEAAAVEEARTVLGWAGVPLEPEANAKAGEHAWAPVAGSKVERCTREGCTVRRNPICWQKKHSAHWRPLSTEPIPPCAGK